MRTASNAHRPVRPRERMNSPQQQRKALQTARGFNYMGQERRDFLRERRAELRVAPHPARDRRTSPPLRRHRLHVPMPRPQAGFAPVPGRADESAAGRAGSPANCAGLRDGVRRRLIQRRRAKRSKPLHPSAQADIAFSQPRIHSPRLAGASSLSDSRLRMGFAPVPGRADESAAGRAGSPANCAGLRDGVRRRVIQERRAEPSKPPHPSAQADIAFSQPRIHSPGGSARTLGCRRAAISRLPNLPQGFLGEVGEIYEPGGGAWPARCLSTSRGPGGAR